MIYSVNPYAGENNALEVHLVVKAHNEGEGPDPGTILEITLTKEQARVLRDELSSLPACLMRE